jgi:hypothetical protein
LDDCTEGDGFLSIGLQHPDVSYGCFGGQHDFWAIKTDDDLASDNRFDGGLNGCVNADYGVAFGGKKKDNGHSAVQMCDGYLLAGITESNNKKQSCSLCQVSCNHYECTETPTEDIWLAKIDGSGELIWNESIGTSGNDGAYVVKSVSADTYIVGGYTTSSNADKDWYLVKFSIIDCGERLSSEVASLNQTSIYPNPTNGTFTISLGLANEINELASIEILDLAGRIVTTDEIAIHGSMLKKQISVMKLPSGFYWIRISAGGNVYQAKLVLQ